MTNKMKQNIFNGNIKQMRIQNLCQWQEKDTLKSTQTARELMTSC